MSRPPLEYVLVTPARNEAAYLELTIRSMVIQTCRPLRWVIVSDGSTDATDEIATRHAEEHDWIEFIRMPPRTSRDFAGKVGAFNAGLARTRDLAYDLVGNLDADLSFEPGHFEFLLERFVEDPRLGLAGTPFSEHGVTYNYRFSSTEHVSGALQLFRRECFEAIGGYVPLKEGGIDDVAVLSARMKGWRTRTFVERTCVHHRPMSSVNHKNRVRAHLKQGQRAYALGVHPLWQIVRSIYQMGRKPYISGGCALSAGYFWAMLRRADRPVSDELIGFQRRDQMRRLRAFVSSLGGQRASR